MLWARFNKTTTTTTTKTARSRGEITQLQPSAALVPRLPLSRCFGLLLLGPDALGAARRGTCAVGMHHRHPHSASGIAVVWRRLLRCRAPRKVTRLARRWNRGGGLGNAGRLSIVVAMVVTTLAIPRDGVGRGTAAVLHLCRCLRRGSPPQFRRNASSRESKPPRTRLSGAWSAFQPRELWAHEHIKRAVAVVVAAVVVVSGFGRVSGEMKRNTQKEKKTKARTRTSRCSGL